MQALILAGGKSTRLRNLAEETPKPLLPILGTTFLGWTLSILRKLPKISEIIVITGYQHELVEAYVNENFISPNIRLYRTPHYQKGRLLVIKELEPQLNDDVIIINADHLYPLKLYQKLLEQQRKLRGITLTTFHHRPATPDEMKIRRNPDGSVEMSKKLHPYQYGYVALITISRDSLPVYFECAAGLLATAGEQAQIEDLVYPISLKAPINFCDLSEFHFMEADTPEEYEEAVREAHKLQWDPYNFLSRGYGKEFENARISHLSSGGYLNRSFLVETGKQGKKYVLQEVKPSLRNLEGEFTVFDFLHWQGFPAPLVVSNAVGGLVTNFSQMPFPPRSFVLSGYLAGHSPEKFNELTPGQLTAAARTLAHLHRLMRDFPEKASISSTINPNKDINPITISKNTATREEALEICREVQRTLAGKKTEDKDQFDAQVEQVISRKLELLRRYDETSLMAQLGECPKILCHGDYHGANLIFNDSDEVAGVVDWEYCGQDYRVWEVARSMAFICDMHHTGSMLSPVNPEKALLYLSAYHANYRLTAAELKVFVELLKYKSLCSCFVLQKHYLENDLNCDVFLPKSPDYWFWWWENGRLFQQQVLSKLAIKHQQV